MPTSRTAALYSPELLALAIELADFPFDPQAPATGEARSRSCGSTIALSSARPDRIERLGLRVSACAVGQASAAIFAREAAGMTGETLAATLEELRLWLADDRDSTLLPRLELLEPARPHAGRHEAILLPWKAALDALSNPRSAG